MSGSSALYSWFVMYSGSLSVGNNGYNSNSFGGRAVVVIDKATPEVTPPTPSESDATPEEGEVVNAEDTLKMSYIGYIMGVIVIFAGSYVIYLAIEKKYEDIEE